MIAQGVACLVGIWLMAASDVLGIGGGARVNALVVGPIAASFSCVAIWEVGRPLRWVSFALGAWLALSAPFWAEAVVHHVLSGLAIAGLSGIRGRLRHRYGGGWRALYSRK